MRDPVVTGISTQFFDRHLPLYLHDKSPYGFSKTEQNQLFNQTSGCLFDPHCPECIRELWGPLLSPFAYLIKQNAEYFQDIIMRIGQYRIDSTANSPPRHSSKPPKLEYNDHKFMKTSGTCGFHTAKIGWLITWVRIRQIMRYFINKIQCLLY